MAVGTAAPKFSLVSAEALYNKAHAAGLKAGQDAVPNPMIVGSPRNPMGSLMGGDDGGLDPNKDMWYVSEGVCGFAWVTVRPGNSSFARRLASLGIGHKAYYGGWEIWVGEFGQSMARKEAYAQAFAEVLREAGVQAFAGSRMD